MTTHFYIYNAKNILNLIECFDITFTYFKHNIFVYYCRIFAERKKFSIDGLLISFMIITFHILYLLKYLEKNTFLTTLSHRFDTEFLQSETDRKSFYFIFRYRIANCVVVS